MNVALSRGRDAVVVLGDAAMIRRRGAQDNPLYNVLNYLSGADTCVVEAVVL